MSATSSIPPFAALPAGPRFRSAADFRADIASIRKSEGGILGGRGVRVAVLDGPVDATHPCFSRADLEQPSPGPWRGEPEEPALQHGTHVASVIACGDGTIGIAPECTVIVVPIFGRGGSSTARGGLSSPACTQGDLAAAIRLALRHRADIINVSAGQLVLSPAASWDLEQAIAECETDDVLVVAAAGNDGCDCVHVPASLGSVLAVGATDRGGRPLRTSNHGEPYGGHGILAPGEDILGAVPGGRVEAQTGTSFASAIVSGVAALLLGIQRARGRDTSPRAVGATLLASAWPCTEDTTITRAQCLTGRLDIISAYERISKEELDMSTTTYSETSGTAETAHVTPQGAPEGAAPPDAVATYAPLPAATRAPAQVRPSGCGCAGGGPARIIFTFGQLGYDFASETRRDVITSQLPTGEDPYNLPSLLGLLDRKPNIIPYVTWLLRANETPIYALAPEGPYAAATYEALVKALGDRAVELVSIGGVITGRVQLSSGAWVDQVSPVPWAIYTWSTSALVESAVKAAPAAAGNDSAALNQALKDFLTRVYYEKRNRGESPEQRALNYAVTNIFQFNAIFAATSQRMLRLDSIQVTKSAFCRDGSDCYDVQTIFFNPLKQFEEARHVYQFTVDVSDVVPVLVGELRTWALS